MSGNDRLDTEQAEPSQNPARLYIVIAVVLVAVIVVAGILLITVGIPVLRGDKEPTAVSEGGAVATPVPTYTPGPTRAPTNTPPPAPTSTPQDLVMGDTDTPVFEFQSAGARPGFEWTGFFGQVLDAAGNPLTDVSVIVWYRDGTPASPVVETDGDGYYEIRLADAALAGSWSIQVLTDGWQPASKLFTFNTDEDTEAGIQQIQVIWQKLP